MMMLISACVSTQSAATFDTSRGVGGGSATTTPLVSSSRPPSMRHVAGDLVAFDYPAAWDTRTGAINPGGNWTIEFVSPQTLPSECVESSTGGVCYTWPRMRLSENGIVVAFRYYGRPGLVPPTPTSLGDRSAANVSRSADSACAAIGGDQSVTIVEPQTVGQVGWLAIDACLAAPDHRAGEALFDAMLASVSIP